MGTYDEDQDQARKSLAFAERLKFIQKAFETFDKCRYPVLVGVDGYCIGGGKQIYFLREFRY